MFIWPILLTSFAGFAIAIVLVEKQNQWPATALRPIISWILRRFHKKLPEMLSCTVCTSFWMALIADGILTLQTWGKYWPLWPLSGLIAVGMSWCFIQLLNAIDPQDVPDDTPNSAE